MPTGENDYMQSEINHLSQWCTDNKMLINSSKTKLMNVSLDRNLLLPNLTLDLTVLPTVTSMKLLGVIFSASTSVKEHGDYIVRRCSSGMAAIRRLRRSGISGNDLWLAYNALVVCHMTYCWASVCDMPQSIMNKYMTIEKEAIRLSGRQRDVSLKTLLDRIARDCVANIANDPFHPLRTLFHERSVVSTGLRNRCRILPVNSSRRLLKSVAGFYKHS